MAYSEELVQRVRSILDEVPGLVEKKMFGGVSYIVNGNMACGVIGEQLIVRMSKDEYADALKHPHARVFDMTGRAMKG
jgi:TfoX/Sxy family transcriptional regulator of competence genes